MFRIRIFLIIETKTDKNHRHNSLLTLVRLELGKIGTAMEVV